MPDDFTIEIKPLKGMSTLDFGCTTGDAKKIFGEPDETETLKDDVLNADSLVYHYWDKGFSLFFNKQANLKLTCIEIDSPEAKLWGEAVFHFNEEQVTELFKENGYDVTETEEHEWGERRVSFDEALMDLYFENGQLVSINFGLFPDEESYYYFPN
jgi:hypothetical protein